MEEFVKEDCLKSLLKKYYVNKALLKPFFRLKPPQRVYTIDGVEFKEYFDTSIDDEIVHYVVREEPITVSDGEETSDDSLELSVKKVVNGVVINSDLFIGEHSWNTVVPLGDIFQCAICDVIITKEELEGHITSDLHLNTLDKCKPLKEHHLNIARKIKLHYHCGICNAIVVTDIAEHIETNPHNQNYNYAAKKAAALMPSKINDAPANAPQAPVNNGPVRNPPVGIPQPVRPNMIYFQQYYTQLYNNALLFYNRMAHNMPANVRPMNYGPVNNRPVMIDSGAMYTSTYSRCVLQYRSPVMSVRGPVNYGSVSGPNRNVWPSLPGPGLVNNAPVNMPNTRPSLSTENKENKKEPNINKRMTMIATGKNLKVNTTLNNASDNGPDNNGPGDNRPVDNGPVTLSYASAAKKVVMTAPEYLLKEYNNKVVKVKFDSWNMLIPRRNKTYYCMACQMKDIMDKLEHSNTENHLAMLQKCRIVDAFEFYFIRQVDDKFYHCGHCNNLQFTPDMANHIELYHPQSKKHNPITKSIDEKIRNGSIFDSQTSINFSAAVKGSNAVKVNIADKVGENTVKVGDSAVKFGNDSVKAVSAEKVSDKGKTDKVIEATKISKASENAVKLTVTKPISEGKGNQNAVKVDNLSKPIPEHIKPNAILEKSTDYAAVVKASTNVKVTSVKEDAPAVKASTNFKATSVKEEAPAVKASNNIKVTSVKEVAPAVKASNNIKATSVKVEAPAVKASNNIKVTSVKVEAPAVKASNNIKVTSVKVEAPAAKASNNIKVTSVKVEAPAAKASNNIKVTSVKEVAPAVKAVPDTRATDSPGSQSDAKSDRDTDSPESVKVGAQPKFSFFQKTTNIYLSEIKICPFDMEIKINLLSYNTVFTSADNLVCGLCDDLVPKEDPVHHICGTLHTEILRCTPFIYNFNNNLIREIRDRLHCAICNVFMAHDNIFNHIMNPPHTTLFTKASGSDKLCTQPAQAPTFRPPTPGSNAGANLGSNVSGSNIPALPGANMPGAVPNPMFGWWPPLSQCGMPMPNPLLQVPPFAPQPYPVWPYMFQRCPTPAMVPAQNPSQPSQTVPTKSDVEDGAKPKKKPDSPGTNVHAMVFTMGGTYKTECEEEVKLNEKKIDSNVIKEIAKVKEKAAKSSEVKTETKIQEQSTVKTKGCVKKIEIDELRNPKSDVKTEKIECKIDVNEKDDTADGSKTPNETNGSNDPVNENNLDSNDVASRITADILSLLNDTNPVDQKEMDDTVWDNNLIEQARDVNNIISSKDVSYRDAPSNYTWKIEDIYEMPPPVLKNANKNDGEIEEIADSWESEDNALVKAFSSLPDKDLTDASEISLDYNEEDFIKNIWSKGQDDLAVESKNENWEVKDNTDNAVNTTQNSINKPNLANIKSILKNNEKPKPLGEKNTNEIHTDNAEGASDVIADKGKKKSKQEDKEKNQKCHTKNNSNPTQEKSKNNKKAKKVEEKLNVKTKLELNETKTPKELETTVLDAEETPDDLSVNESASDQNEITFDVNEPYDTEEYIYLKLRDIMFKISFSAYNSLVPIGDGNRYCFVCWEQVLHQDLKRHVASPKHDDNIKSCKFMYHYKWNLIRWKNSAYHCGVCNVVVFNGIQKHLTWQYHTFQMEEIKRSPRQLTRDLKKGDIKQIRPFMTKKVYTCTNPPKLTILECQSIF